MQKRVRYFKYFDGRRSMTSNSDRRTSPSRSQLIVEDPSAFLQQLKQRLTLKEGIPESQQRLVFSVPQSTPANSEPPEPRTAEDILAELGSWQAILYRNGKALGRLLAPQLSTTQDGKELQSVDPEWQKRGVVVEVISVVYSQWQPAWLRAHNVSKPLYLAVDKDFVNSQYTLQVIGRSGGRPFVVPFTYQFSGREVSLSLELESQRADYIRRHQLACQPKRGSHSASHRSHLTVECGKGLTGLTAGFDGEDRPKWLKSVGLRFAVVASALIDDAAPARAQPSMLPERPRGAGLQNKAADAPSQSQVTKESWLPKMAGQVSGGVGKKSKSKLKARAHERSRAPSSQERPKEPVSEPRPPAPPERAPEPEPRGPEGAIQDHRAESGKGGAELRMRAESNAQSTARGEEASLGASGERRELKQPGPAKSQAGPPRVRPSQAARDGQPVAAAELPGNRSGPSSSAFVPPHSPEGRLAEVGGFQAPAAPQRPGPVPEATQSRRPHQGRTELAEPTQGSERTSFTVQQQQQQQETQGGDYKGDSHTQPGRQPENGESQGSSRGSESDDSLVTASSDLPRMPEEAQGVPAAPPTNPVASESSSGGELTLRKIFDLVHETPSSACELALP